MDAQRREDELLDVISELLKERSSLKAEIEGLKVELKQVFELALGPTPA